MNSKLLSPAPTRRARGLTVGVIAGFAGGVAEVAWIMLYQALTGNEAAQVARGVTDSVIPSLAAAPSAVALGIIIHMALAVALGVALALAIPRALPRIAGTLYEPLTVIAALVAVWAINFFVLLPIINPDFVTLVPYAASLVSKTLFGFAAAVVIRLARR
jgi:hypothetical protein